MADPAFARALLLDRWQTHLVACCVQDIFVDGLNEVQLDLKEMPFLHREPSRTMVSLYHPSFASLTSIRFHMNPSDRSSTDWLRYACYNTNPQAVLTAADAMTRNVQKFRAIERAGVLENVLQVCHSTFNEMASLRLVGG